MSPLRPRALALLLALATAAPAAARGPVLPPAAEVAAVLRRIESARLRGELKALRGELEAQAEAHPDDAMRRVYVAWTDFPQDSCWNALRDISVFHPENPWPHVGMGLVYLRWRMPAEAGRAFATALKVAPGFGPALTGEAQRLVLEGRTKEAEARYREALAQLDVPETRAALGLLLLEAGREAEARPLLERAVADWPDQPEVLDALTRLAKAAGDARAAAELGERRLALSPTDAGAHRAQAQVWLALGEKARALALLGRYEALGGAEPAVLWRAARLAGELGQAEAEARTLRRLEAVAPRDAEVHLRLAEQAADRGDTAEVDARLARAAQGEVPAALRVRQAHLLVARERLGEAVEALRAAPGEAPAREEAEALGARMRLRAAPVKGDTDTIYSRVSVSLVALYSQRLKERPDLSGVLRLRVTVDEAGRARMVTVVHDTLKDPLMAGHAYLAFKDAQYPPGQAEPVFQYVFRPPRGE